MGCGCAKKTNGETGGPPEITCRFGEATSRRWNGGSSFVILCRAGGVVASGQYRTHGVAVPEADSRFCNPEKCAAFEPVETMCRHARPTRTPWLPGRNCYAVRCFYHGPISEPSRAFVCARRATVGDSLFLKDHKINTLLTPNAKYINVRSCFCNAGDCKYYDSRQG